MKRIPCREEGDEGQKLREVDRGRAGVMGPSLYRGVERGVK